MRRNNIILSVFAVLVMVSFSFAAVGAQSSTTLSEDDINIIVTKVVEMLSPKLDEMKETIKTEVIQSIQQAAQNENEQQTNIEQIAVPTEVPTVVPTEMPTETPVETKQTYAGPHVKMVNAYAYVNGESVDGKHTYKSEYYPNELFTLDVVFENDGDSPLPPNLELRHTGNNGEYTGHTESAYSNREIAVMPGERVGFSFACHGSENIGNIVFYFTMFDQDSGNPINGGSAYFAYLARP